MKPKKRAASIQKSENRKENIMENTSMYRIERDSIGEKKVPRDVYYGVQTLRAVENFPMTGLTLHTQFVNSLAYIKKATALANLEAGQMERPIADAIIQACDEIIGGKLHDHFVVDPIQGGAGTSMNMNANEVIANRAIEILGGTRGDYTLVNPNDHVNYGQSTNDVIPTAGKITTLRLLENLLSELISLQTAFEGKAVEFDDVIKMGRTQMQDAVPVRLGQEFRAYADSVQRGIARIKKAAFLAVGNDVTITMAAEAGQLELNAFEPIIFYCLFQSIDTLTHAIHTFTENCVVGITANADHCRDLVENSVGIITALAPHIGYQYAADIAKQALKTGTSVRKLILEENLLSEGILNVILNPISLTMPGIPGKKVLK